MTSKVRDNWDTPTTWSDVAQAQTAEKLFDITCTIGSVYAGGTEDPYELAFKLIARHGADGTFDFPREDGRMVHLTIQTDAPIQ